MIVVVRHVCTSLSVVLSPMRMNTFAIWTPIKHFRGRIEITSACSTLNERNKFQLRLAALDKKEKVQFSESTLEEARKALEFARSEGGGKRLGANGRRRYGFRVAS